MSNDKHLIENSTKEERQKIINEALAISTLDAKPPTEEDMKLFQRYIDGELELDEIKKILIEKYADIE
jgi:Antitoxin VbhA